MKNIKVLSGHISPETAFVVDDYPYGFRLRCHIRYWLDYKPGKGVRLWSQTTNPKRGDVWNKPKASTYQRLGGALYLDVQGHVTWGGVTEYDDAAKMQDFNDTLGAGLPVAARKEFDTILELKKSYDAFRAEKAQAAAAAEMKP